MSYVLTLVGKPLDPDRAARLLEGAATPDWLGPDACDIRFAGPAPERAEALLRPALPGVDLLAQPREGRRKRLLVADMDSTIITVECIDEMADMLGLKPKIAAITERAMRGEIDFPAALRERVALLKGLPLADLERVWRERIRLTPGARALALTMRANGAYAALVSGGFSFFTERVREAAGFDWDQANELAVQGAGLAGTVREPILDSGAKLAALRRLAAERGLGPAETLAVGDGANDLDMIRAAGLGVAFHAKPVVAEAARARVDYGDLTTLLYFQGYRRSEFAG
jgi:phosphoserine phosphatase